MKSSNVKLALTALAASAIVVACGTSEQRLVFDPDETPSQPPPLATPDAGEWDGSVPSTPTVYMCPSDKCQGKYATCSTSKYLCDIDLSNDPENCGACGHKCPTDSWRSNELHAMWVCVEGTCQMQCSTEFFGECNGHIEDGCETSLTTNTNCGTCGNACANGAVCRGGTCETCKPGEVYCDGICTNLTSNDYACGACDNWCNFWPPPGAPAPPKNMKYGCVDSTCDQLKCNSPWTNCNGDLEDGCEVDLTKDPKNCGRCGDACAAGEVCVGGTCQCDRGPDGCGCLDDFESDVLNCGGCGVMCLARPHSKPICKFGKCGMECEKAYADCNLDVADGCEVNLEKDPQHCGACGVTCETGQACTNGACATEPCPAGVTR